jgi:hypothetical protein
MASTTQYGIDTITPITTTILPCLGRNMLGFAGRYYSRTTEIQGKVLTQSEALVISNGGMQIVTLYEDDPIDYTYFSAARGTADANGALAQAANAGQPSGTAIYFTVDYDAGPDEIAGNITAYFQAVAEAFGDIMLVGVYGSGAVCAAITGAGLAQYSWLAQSTGWSDSSQYTQYSIKQGPTQTLCGISCDSDVSNGPFGAFSICKQS